MEELLDDGVSEVDGKGWLPWAGGSAPETVFYGEFGNFGAGASTEDRVKWKGLRRMDEKKAKKFTVGGGFLGGHGWIQKGGVPFKSGL